MNIKKVGLLISLSGMLFLFGCSATKDHYLIASTGTNIGLELSQDPVNQSPKAKLGYNRAELAIVPTNRATCKLDGQGKPDCSSTIGGQGNGAKDTTDVLMELRYGGFSFTGSGGIYQRLAVGETAVSQPGAAFMFARKADGDMEGETAKAVAKSIDPEALAAEQVISADVISGKVFDGDTLSSEKLTKLFSCFGYDDDAAAKRAERYEGKSEEEFKEQFLKDYRWEAPTMLGKYEECNK